MLILALFGILSVVGIAATLRALRTDGYRQVPTRANDRREDHGPLPASAKGTGISLREAAQTGNARVTGAPPAPESSPSLPATSW